MNLKSFIPVLMILFFASLDCKGAVPFSDETLHYVISYKWGMVHKDAGEATLSLRNHGNEYKVMLSARTKPWADKFYSVRDTLAGAIRKKDFMPLSYDKITHEKGKYARDEIKYSKTGDTTTGYVTRFKLSKKGQATSSEKTLTANGPVYDMLSVFYYLRRLDYSALDKNRIYTATVFSGSKKEKISIRSLGREKITLRNKKTCEAYHIKFNFTQEGGKKSSDDIDTWISTEPDHIPLYLVGKLPIGQVRAYFTGSGRK